MNKEINRTSWVEIEKSDRPIRPDNICKTHANISHHEKPAINKDIQRPGRNNFLINVNIILKTGNE